MNLITIAQFISLLHAGTALAAFVVGYYFVFNVTEKDVNKRITQRKYAVCCFALAFALGIIGTIIYGN